MTKVLVLLCMQILTSQNGRYSKMWRIFCGIGDLLHILCGVPILSQAGDSRETMEAKRKFCKTLKNKQEVFEKLWFIRRHSRVSD